MPAEKTLWVHCGPHKTGSSAIQFLFKDLDDPTLLYPKAGQWADGSHNMVMFALLGAKNWGTVQIPPKEDLTAEVAAELVTAPGDALISTESLVSPARLRLFLKSLGDAPAGFDRIKPIYVLRHPLERAASDYNQIVKDPAHGYGQLPSEYLNERLRPHLLAPQVQAWQSAFPETLFLSYHPAQTLVPRLCEAIGRPDLAPETPPWRNRSLNGLGLALVLLGNRHNPSAQAKQTFFHRLREPHKLKIWSGASFPFAATLTGEILSGPIAQDLTRVEEMIGLSFADWTPPDPIALDTETSAQIRDVAKAELPVSETLEADIKTVIAALHAQT